MIKNFLKSIYIQIPLPILLGREFRRYRHQLNKTQWFTLQQLKELQTIKLRVLIKHVYENVPYYQRLFKTRGLTPDDITELEDLAKLPFLTKSLVRENFNDLLSKNFKRYRPVIGHSGGSTGERLEFYLSRQAIAIEQAAYWRHYNWAGYNFGDKCASFCLPFPEEISHLLWYFNPKDRIFHFNTAKFNSSSLVTIVEKLVEYQPRVIWAFPSYLYLLVKYLKSRGISKIKPLILLTSAEMLYDYQRKEIEEFFGVKVFEWYGLGEHVVSASQCEYGGYHINLEYTVMEFIKDDKFNDLDGYYEIVGTNLDNYAMPFLRYRTSDLGKPTNKLCSCGRKLSLISEIGGRTQDVLITPEGVKRLPHTQFSFHEIPNLKELQIVQETTQQLRIKIVKTPAFSRKDEEALIKMVKERIGFEVEVVIEPVEYIPRTIRVKYQLVVSKVPVEL